MWVLWLHLVVVALPTMVFGSTFPVTISSVEVHSTKIIVKAKIQEKGSIYCEAHREDVSAPTADEIGVSGDLKWTANADRDIEINISGLEPSTPHRLFCGGKADSGLSSDEEDILDAHLFFETYGVPEVLETTNLLPNAFGVSWDVKIDHVGSIFAVLQETTGSMNEVPPTQEELIEVANSGGVSGSDLPVAVKKTFTTEEVESGDYVRITLENSIDVAHLTSYNVYMLTADTDQVIFSQVVFGGTFTTTEANQVVRATVSLGTAVPTAHRDITVTVTFDKSVTGFSIDDIFIGEEGQAVSSLNEVVEEDDTYRLIVAPTKASGKGVFDVYVSQSSISYGTKTNSQSNVMTITFDRVGSASELSCSPETPARGSSLECTIVCKNGDGVALLGLDTDYEASSSLGIPSALSTDDDGATFTFTVDLSDTTLLSGDTITVSSELVVEGGHIENSPMIIPFADEVTNGTLSCDTPSGTDVGVNTVVNCNVALVTESDSATKIDLRDVTVDVSEGTVGALYLSADQVVEFQWTSPDGWQRDPSTDIELTATWTATGGSLQGSPQSWNVTGVTIDDVTPLVLPTNAEHTMTLTGTYFLSGYFVAVSEDEDRCVISEGHELVLTEDNYPDISTAEATVSTPLTAGTFPVCIYHRDEGIGYRDIGVVAIGESIIYSLSLTQDSLTAVGDFLWTNMVFVESDDCSSVPIDTIGSVPTISEDLKTAKVTVDASDVNSLCWYRPHLSEFRQIFGDPAVHSVTPRFNEETFGVVEFTVEGASMLDVMSIVLVKDSVCSEVSGLPITLDSESSGRVEMDLLDRGSYQVCYKTPNADTYLLLASTTTQPICAGFVNDGVADDDILTFCGNSQFSGSGTEYTMSASGDLPVLQVCLGGVPDYAVTIPITVVNEQGVESTAGELNQESCLWDEVLSLDLAPELPDYQQSTSAFTIIVGPVSSQDPVFDGHTVTVSGIFDGPLSAFQESFQSIAYDSSAGDQQTPLVVTASSNELRETDGELVITVLPSSSWPSGDMIVFFDIISTLGAISLSPTKLAFSESTWAVPSTVTLTGASNNVAGDGGEFEVVVTSDVSDATHSISILNIDDDFASIVLSALSSELHDSFASSAYFNVSLTSRPISSVEINFVSSSSRAVLAESSVKFLPSTWATPQTIMVTGVSSSDVLEREAFSIGVASVTTTDGTYSQLSTASLRVDSTVSQLKEPQVLAVETSADPTELLVYVSDYDGISSINVNGVEVSVTRFVDGSLTGAAAFVVTIPDELEGQWLEVSVSTTSGFSHSASSLVYSSACSEDTYLSGTACLPCPTHGVCNGAPSIFASFGFFSPNSSESHLVQCTSPSSRCLGTQYHLCAVGYDGASCDLCDDDYHSLTGICEECPNTAVSVVLLVLSILFVLSLCLSSVRWQHEPKKFDLYYWTVMRVQQFARIGLIASPFLPMWLRETYRALALSMLDFEFTKLECVVGALSFDSKFYIHYIVLAVACLFPGAVFAVKNGRLRQKAYSQVSPNKMLDRYVSENAGDGEFVRKEWMVRPLSAASNRSMRSNPVPKVDSPYWGLFVRVSGLTLWLMYPLLLFRSLSGINCIDDRLQVEHGQVCSEGWHPLVMTVSAVSVAVLGLCFPVGTVLSIRRYRRAIRHDNLFRVYKPNRLEFLLMDQLCMIGMFLAATFLYDEPGARFVVVSSCFVLYIVTLLLLRPHRQIGFSAMLCAQSLMNVLFEGWNLIVEVDEEDSTGQALVGVCCFMLFFVYMTLACLLWTHKFREMKGKQGVFGPGFVRRLLELKKLPKTHKSEGDGSGAKADPESEAAVNAELNARHEEAEDSFIHEDTDPTVDDGDVEDGDLEWSGFKQQLSMDELGDVEIGDAHRPDPYGARLENREGEAEESRGEEVAVSIAGHATNDDNNVSASPPRSREGDHEDLLAPPRSSSRPTSERKQRAVMFQLPDEGRASLGAGEQTGERPRSAGPKAKRPTSAARTRRPQSAGPIPNATTKKRKGPRMSDNIDESLGSMSRLSPVRQATRDRLKRELAKPHRYVVPSSTS